MCINIHEGNKPIWCSLIKKGKNTLRAVPRDLMVPSSSSHIHFYIFGTKKYSQAGNLQKLKPIFPNIWQCHVLVLDACSKAPSCDLVSSSYLYGFIYILTYIKIEVLDLILICVLHTMREMNIDIVHIMFDLMKACVCAYAYVIVYSCIVLWNCGG